VQERLADVRYWLYSYQEDQMREDDRSLISDLVQNIKADLIVAAMQTPETPQLCKRIEKSVDQLAAMVPRS
jgi:hypothetical protein